MTPRLNTSIKWTALPEEYQEKILEVLNDGFKEQAKVGHFHIEGRIYKKEILVRIGYLANGRLAQINSEVSLEYDYQKDNIQNMIGIAIDACGGLIDSYFAKTDGDFPRDWMKYEFEGRELYLQLSTVNTDLEKQADELLGIEADDSLVKGSDDDEELEAIHKMLGLNESDSNDEDKN